MNQPQDLDERLRAHLANEATTRAPGWVLDNLLDSVQSTPQRRRPWMPRRYLHMSASFKLAVGTAIIALVSAGGRVLSVVATGADLAKARDRAYRAVDRIGLKGSTHRTDIALAAQRGEITVPQ